MHISPERIATHIQALSKIGNLGPELRDGFTRASWSPEESEAMNYIRSIAEQYGLISKYDGLGNLFLTLKNDIESNEVIQIGSHLDTIVKGGLFDGATGIIAGLEAIIEISKSKEKLKKDLQLVIWRGEESGTFGFAYKGSKAAFGLLPPSSLNSRYGELTLKDAIISQGYDPTYIENSIKTISQAEIDRINSHFELHIEQATKLEKDEDDIGIVTSIRGVNNYRVTIRGKASHSGATPMGTKYRQDANLAMAYMHVALDSLSKEKINQGVDLVQTVGVINSDKAYNLNHPEIYDTGLTTICAMSYFYLNIRSNNKEFLNQYALEVSSLIREIGDKFNTQVQIDKISNSDPLQETDRGLQKLVEDSAKKLGLRTQRLASGAGHDVQIVAQQSKSNGSHIPSILIFIPCKEGISHNPEEFASNDAIAKGASVLATAINELATS